MRDFLVLLALCVTGFFLGKYQTAERTVGKGDAFHRIALVAVSPVQIASSSVATVTGDFLTGVAYGKSLLEQNRALKSELAAMALYQETLSRLEMEIEALRKLHDLPGTAGKQKIVGQVIGFFKLENRVTLNIGLRQGVRPGLAVTSGGALIGVVQTANAESSQALLLSSPSQKIGAMVMRNPPAAGLMRGETATELKLEFVDPAAPVQVGDLVVTSGFSEHIPRGIPIGRVIQVEDNPEFGSRTAQVFPNVMIGSVREVVVLR